ncbi:MAG: hypothetical protein JJ867_06365 [Marinobacter sp.]|nr:hypothetical protein [Marinobacter sp.]
MTTQNIMIEEESEIDIPAISAITIAAFQPLEMERWCSMRGSMPLTHGQTHGHS